MLTTRGRPPSYGVLVLVSNSGTRRFSYRASDLFKRLPPGLQNAQRLTRFKRQLMELLLSEADGGR